ncbi:hypothetical protein P692DRAFT_20732307 [Suillus brevipes Sb2]|nr:hypothetical protein P692DRAFT_20732307 [Suillus brevipes Sb2]
MPPEVHDKIVTNHHLNEKGTGAHLYQHSQATSLTFTYIQYFKIIQDVIALAHVNISRCLRQFMTKFRQTAITVRKERGRTGITIVEHSHLNLGMLIIQ